VQKGKIKTKKNISGITSPVTVKQRTSFDITGGFQNLTL
jgi:hypothetical protein